MATCDAQARIFRQLFGVSRSQDRCLELPNSKKLRFMVCHSIPGKDVASLGQLNSHVRSKVMPESHHSSHSLSKLGAPARRSEELVYEHLLLLLRSILCPQNTRAHTESRYDATESPANLYAHLYGYNACVHVLCITVLLCFHSSTSGNWPTCPYEVILSSAMSSRAQACLGKSALRSTSASLTLNETCRSCFDAFEGDSIIQKNFKNVSSHASMGSIQTPSPTRAGT